MDKIFYRSLLVMWFIWLVFMSHIGTVLTVSYTYTVNDFLSLFVVPIWALLLSRVIKTWDECSETYFIFYLVGMFLGILSALAIPIDSFIAIISAYITLFVVLLFKDWGEANSVTHTKNRINSYKKSILNNSKDPGYTDKYDKKELKENEDLLKKMTHPNAKRHIALTFSTFFTMPIAVGLGLVKGTLILFAMLFSVPIAFTVGKICELIKDLWDNIFSGLWKLVEIAPLYLSKFCRWISAKDTEENETEKK